MKDWIEFKKKLWWYCHHKAWSLCEGPISYLFLFMGWQWNPGGLAKYRLLIPENMKALEKAIADDSLLDYHPKYK